MAFCFSLFTFCLGLDDVVQMNFILSGLNESQKKAVQHIEGPLLILAGAGSGKTRTIVHRIAYLIHERKVPPYKIVAVTFTNKATQEMLERTLSLAGQTASDCLIRTYHSLGLYLLRVYSRYLDYPSSFTIWDDSDQLNMIDSIVSSHFSLKLSKIKLRYISNSISSFKDEIISPHELPDILDLDSYEYSDILQEVYKMYEDQKTNALAMDFSDLIYKTVKLLKKNPEVLEEIHKKYSYFLVDEYQDTNRAQYELIYLLSRSSKNLCVVGDDDQAIYAWRGADVRNILNFNENFPDTTTIKLEQNYRSVQRVLNIANEVIQNNASRMEKKLWTANENGEFPQLIIVNSDRGEAKDVCRIILELSTHIPLSEMGILYRMNSQSRLIEESLLNFKIPYRVYGGISFFGRKEVKDILSYIRILVNPYDETSFLRMVNTPSRGIGDKSIQKLCTHRNQLYSESGHNIDFITLLGKASDVKGISAKISETMAHLSVWLKEMHERVKRQSSLDVLLEDILEKSGLGSYYSEEDKLLDSKRTENIEELRNSIQYHQKKNPGALFSDYLQEISLYSTPIEIQNDFNGVQLMTVHSAKGLEFQVVFVLSLDQSIFPSYYSIAKESYEEERRLFYVAVTRAKKRLYLFRSLYRFRNGFLQKTEPSTFISEISEDSIECIERAGLHNELFIGTDSSY